MSEYLSHFGKDFANLPSWQGILESGEPIDRDTLIAFLAQANKYLCQKPGPNLARRRELAPDWLGWWIQYLVFLKKDVRPGLLLPLENIRRYKDPDFHTGVLFVGGLEGHRGHRQAVGWMLSFVRPVLLFEQDEYLAAKERNGPFLPLGVRLSMWSRYSPDLTLSVLPPRNPEVSESAHYQQIFDKTGSDYCFATEGDPYQEEKRGRGQPAGFTLIPNAAIETTTNRVQRLF